MEIERSAGKRNREEGVKEGKAWRKERHGGRKGMEEGKEGRKAYSPRIGRGLRIKKMLRSHL